MDFATIMTNIFFGLFKASLLFVFIYAIVEVIKDVSIAGLAKVIWQIGRSPSSSATGRSRRSRTSWIR